MTTGKVNITAKKLRRCMKEVNRDLRLHLNTYGYPGFHPRTGDCGNFAVALGRVLGVHDYYGIWDNDEEFDEGEPIHCTLHWKGGLWDGNGVMSLEEFAGRWRKYVEHGEKGVVGSGSARRICQILDYDRISEMERLIRGQLTAMKSIDRKKCR
jgi:hypothetical protein